jgi:hypothetical protein
MKTFYDVRNLPGLKKKPSTSELLDWLKLLVAEDIPLEALQSTDSKVSVPPLVGALLKNEQDTTLFEKLVFMNQRNWRATGWAGCSGWTCLRRATAPPASSASCSWAWAAAWGCRRQGAGARRGRRVHRRTSSRHEFRRAGHAVRTRRHAGAAGTGP